jgi:hypothetical protein
MRVQTRVRTFSLEALLAIGAFDRVLEGAAEATFAACPLRSHAPGRKRLSEIVFLCGFARLRELDGVARLKLLICERKRLDLVMEEGFDSGATAASPRQVPCIKVF